MLKDSLEKTEAENQLLRDAYVKVVEENKNLKQNEEQEEQEEQEENAEDGLDEEDQQQTQEE